MKNHQIHDIVSEGDFVGFFREINGDVPGVPEPNKPQKTRFQDVNENYSRGILKIFSLEKVGSS